MAHQQIIKEHFSDRYSPRTYYNANSSDLTIAFAVDMHTKGELLTKKAAADKYIGFQLDDRLTAQDAADKILKDIINKNKHRKIPIQSINIAGNGIYTLVKQQCSQEFINLFVFNVLDKVHAQYPIKKIYSGGQTGVDLAGIVAADVLEINFEMTLPKGFQQRNAQGIDHLNTHEMIVNQVKLYKNNLEKNIAIARELKNMHFDSTTSSLKP